MNQHISLNPATQDIVSEQLLDSDKADGHGQSTSILAMESETK
ncbi:hypothetical protein LJR231_005362 [Phyllobacterium sp. LjRoot231]